jgi:hypothetical protein
LAGFQKVMNRWLGGFLPTRIVTLTIDCLGDCEIGKGLNPYLIVSYIQPMSFKHQI